MLTHFQLTLFSSVFVLFCFFFCHNKLLWLSFTPLNRLCSNCSKIILVAIQDEGSIYISPAIDALKRVGATHDLLHLTDYRGSFALVGYAGVNKPPWIAQQSAKRGKGPSEISLTIPSPTGRSPSFLILSKRQKLTKKNQSHLKFRVEFLSSFRIPAVITLDICTDFSFC